jgi:hypothetical protein
MFPLFLVFPSAAAFLPNDGFRNAYLHQGHTRVPYCRYHLRLLSQFACQCLLRRLLCHRLGTQHLAGRPFSHPDLHGGYVIGLRCARIRLSRSDSLAFLPLLENTISGSNLLFDHCSSIQLSRNLSHSQIYRPHFRPGMVKAQAETVHPNFHSRRCAGLGSSRSWWRFRGNLPVAIWFKKSWETS